MKKNFSYFLYALLFGMVISACSDSLDINQVYAFDLITMPIPKKIAQNETVEIRCRIASEGEYLGTEYHIRMFQYDGTGILQLENGVTLLPNELYLLENMSFRLYYTSLSSEATNFTVFIEDSFGQVVEKVFSFSNVSLENPASL